MKIEIHHNKLLAARFSGDDAANFLKTVNTRLQSAKKTPGSTSLAVFTITEDSIYTFARNDKPRIEIFLWKDDTTINLLAD